MLQHWHPYRTSLLLCSSECANCPFAFCLKVVYGLILGLVGCFICSLTRIWNNGFKRTTAVLFCGLAIMWLGLKLNYLGASSVGCLSLTVLVSLAWERGFPPKLCKGTPAAVCMLQTTTAACLLEWSAHSACHDCLSLTVRQSGLRIRQAHLRASCHWY